MKKQVTEYICDICKKKSNKSSDFKNMLLPCRRKFAETEFKNSINEFDICLDCLEKLSNMFNKYVADITLQYKNNNEVIHSNVRKEFLDYEI